MFGTLEVQCAEARLRWPGGSPREPVDQEGLPGVAKVSRGTPSIVPGKRRSRDGVRRELFDHGRHQDWKVVMFEEGAIEKRMPTRQERTMVETRDSVPEDGSDDDVPKISRLRIKTKGKGLELTAASAKHQERQGESRSVIPGPRDSQTSLFRAE